MLHTSPISPWQFALFRILLGLYLVWHFVALLPYGTELFSSSGLLSDPSLNPTYGLFPNPLYLWDTPLAVALTLGLAILASVTFTLGLARRTSAILLWFIATALFHRNNLIANPSLPYIGLILVLAAFIPAGEPLSLGKKKTKGAWQMPRWILPVATFLLAAGYTFSGWTKLASPSWVDGSALAHVLQNPLARPGFFRDALLAAPELLLQCATWGALLLELLYLPLTLFRRTRPWIWLALVGMHLGLILLIDFADLSLGMLMIHLFTFDPRWLPARRPERVGAKVELAFDSGCLICSRFIHFLAQEDRAQLLRFVPLEDAGNQTTMIVTRDGQKHHRSTAFLVLLETLGGHWRALALLGRTTPRPLRDAIYSLVSKRRERVTPGKTCPLPSSRVKERLA